MATESATERKRQHRAAASPQTSHPWGCVAAAGAVVGTSAGLFALTAWRAFAAVGLLGAIAFLYSAVRYIYGVILLIAVWQTWTKHGVRCLVVHSDSPVWTDHIRSRWLPALGHVARLLNWSERAKWAPSLEVRTFRWFCLADRNYNPAVLVFRGLRAPLVFRFFNAFREAEQGRPQYLESVESQLFTAIGVPRGGPTKS